MKKGDDNFVKKKMKKKRIKHWKLYETKNLYFISFPKREKERDTHDT